MVLTKTLLLKHDYRRQGKLRQSLMSVKFFAHNSMARNGRANFMGAWDVLALSAGKSMPLKFLVFKLGGGGILGLFGEGGGQFLSIWARGFF